MTPNTSDSPEAIRNRNIAAVSPPMNWLNRRRAPLTAGPSPGAGRSRTLLPAHRHWRAVRAVQVSDSGSSSVQ